MAQAADHWVNPMFSMYGPVLGEKLTHFLYNDRSNPLCNQPERWATAGVISIVYRRLDFLALVPGAANSVTQNLSILGGRNAVIINQQCSIRPTVSAAAGAHSPVPNELGQYQTVQMVRQDGLILMDTQPVPMAFQQQLMSQPSAFIPQLWPGNINFNVICTNNAGAGQNVDITLGWTVAMLDTGR